MTKTGARWIEAGGKSLAKMMRGFDDDAAPSYALPTSQEEFEQSIAAYSCRCRCR